MSKNRKPFSFDQELESKLKNLKGDSKQKSNTKPVQKDIIQLIDDVVFELQHDQDSLAFSNLLQAQSKKSKIREQPIHELSELAINEESSIGFKDQKEFLQSRSKHKQKDLGNHIWNLVSNKDVIEFLKSNFKRVKQQQSILLTDFVIKSLSFYGGVSLSQQEVYKIKDHIKADLTTTNPDVLSLNALQILVKKISIQNYIIQGYIEVKVKMEISELNRKNKKIIEGVTDRLDEVTQREQQLEFQLSQFYKRENALNAKEKLIMTKQKQMLQREKQFKKSFEEKSSKLYDTNIHQFGEHVKQTEKRLTQLEKNIKNKIDILERRAQSLKMLIHEKNELKAKKVCSESEAKIKLRKLEKQIVQAEKNHKGQIQQLKLQEKALLKNLNQMEQKLGKNDKKIKKQKQKLQELQNEVLILREKSGALEEENGVLRQALKQLKSRIPQENLMKGIKSKENTTRTHKNKNKKHTNQLAYFVELYEYILSIKSVPENKRYAVSQKDIVNYIKQMLPMIVGLLCGEDDQNDNKKPHFLVLNMAQLAISDLSKLKQKQNLPSRLWSNELSELIQLPFSSFTQVSLFFYLLPILDWESSVALQYFKSTVQIIISALENKGSIKKTDKVAIQQQQLFTQFQFLKYLVYQFISNLPHILKHPAQAKNILEVNLGLASSVIDLFISLSSELEQRSKLSHNAVCQQMLIVAESLTLCIINIYNAETRTGRKRNETIFMHLELIQQLTEKISILLQRVIYYSELTNLCQLDLSTLKPLNRQLQEINEVNGNRHSLILANYNNILSHFQGQ